VGTWKIAVLALGANLGDRQKTIETAIEQLAAQKKIRVLERSPLVESVALTESGEDKSLPSYLNGVIKIATQLRPKKLLKSSPESRIFTDEFACTGGVLER
jgi:2-amino-4-hydroxy-6-hydroxymethyldihydropteridine diphosphokinase